jgi:hypothetical protein
MRVPCPRCKVPPPRRCNPLATDVDVSRPAHPERVYAMRREMARGPCAVCGTRASKTGAFDEQVPARAPVAAWCETDGAAHAHPHVLCPACRKLASAAGILELCPDIPAERVALRAEGVP